MSDDVSAYIQRSGSNGLSDVLDVLLDKGLVLDVFLRVSLVGIELLTVDARVVLASVDTYLRFAEAVSQLDVGARPEGLPELARTGPERMARAVGRGVVEGATEALFGRD
ncbi:MAG: gas vesicle protein [Solirubrobacterales bacterium]|nr:gas vesicle protein [Solirubrobacterales bacterium]